MERSLIWRFLQGFTRFAGTLFFDLKAYGIHNIPPSGGVLLVANHASYLDPVLLAILIRRPLCFMAKSELFENRALGWLIRSLNAYPVRQGEGDVGAIRETIRLLQEGQVLNIFPEGTRCEDGEIAPLEKGVALIIRKARVPVVPVAILGSFNAWSRRQKSVRFCPIRLKYGEPLHLENLKGEQIIRKIDSELHRLLGELRAANS